LVNNGFLEINDKSLSVIVLIHHAVTIKDVD